MGKTLLNLSGFTDGIASDEAGINVEKITIKATQDITKVPNKDGETRGKVLKNQRQEISISGETTGAVTQSLVAPLVVANLTDLGGVNTGLVTITDLTLELSRNGLQTLSISAERDPLVVAEV